MSNRGTIGFDRKLKRGWLDFAAELAISGDDIRDARTRLFAHLEGEVGGTTFNSDRGKTMTVLARLWLTPPPAARDLRNRAAAVFRDSSPAGRLGLHWAMALGTYPFFAGVAETVGRLLRLQEDLALAQVDRRLAESWGERAIIHRSARRICRSMVDWGILTESEVRGTYRPAAKIAVDTRVALLLAEAVLTTLPHGALAASELATHPELFPFRLELTTRNLRASPVFEVERRGLDTDMVSLIQARPSAAVPAPVLLPFDRR